MNVKTQNFEVGIIIGRFQVPKLHEAHIDLIQSVINKHPKVVIFLGLSPCKTTHNNPLDFEARKQMILEVFSHVNVLYIKDEPSDETWSKKLDNQINDLIGPTQKVVLYGGRDSFIPHYKGKHSTIELEPTCFVSGSEIRREITNKVKSSADFRAGVIWAVGNQYPMPFTAVDIAIVDDKWRVLLAKKSNETQYRFIGGFADTNSNCFEDDAIRETQEETGLEVSHPVYIGSAKIQDWRYRNEVNKIKTLLFVVSHVFGSPKANDDISEVKWFSIKDLRKEDLVKEHGVLLDMFLSYAKERAITSYTITP